MKKVLCSCFFLLYSFQVVSEDIELYIGEVSQRTGARPQVLIIFDNSGSMSTPVDIKEAYDPNKTYSASGGGFSSEWIYYRKGNSGTIPTPDYYWEQRRFDEVLNSCETARNKLKTEGFYTGYVRRYTYSGQTGSWTPLPDTDNINNSGRSKAKVVDCWDDVNLKDPTNSQVLSGSSFSNLPAGFPIDGQGNKDNRIYYTDDIEKSNTQIGTGEVVTLYSQNYLRWYHNAPTIKKSRLQIAKETIVSLVNSAPGVDFGLQIFNLNYPYENNRNGGRIVSGITEMTDSAKTSLINTVNSLTASTNTPLCETLYEASRYFGSKSVLYGNDDSSYSNWYVGNQPPRDTSIESNSVYEAPYVGCSNRAYVILITDGTPTVDGGANSAISALPGSTGAYEGSYLASLAGWMNEKDINAKISGDQHVTTFTVGFGEDAVDKAGRLLEETARRGGGQYYPAKDANQLLTSLQAALIEILRVNSSFTSPSVASDNFDRTRTLNSVYYTMFLPELGPRWRGNLKKLELKDDKQVDREDKPAINAAGNISDDAKTFWSNSSTPDGNQVERGGVAEEMAKTAVSSRTVLSDLGSNGALKDLTLGNAVDWAETKDELASLMNVSSDELESYFNWALGYDVDDEDIDGNTSETRIDVFGDPLHSKPLVINYGGTAESQDVRIVVGTNSGALHMFDDAGDTISESWAFMPNEFFSNYKALRINESNQNKVYGIDGSASAYLNDVKGDGSIVKVDGDKAWIFFGLRRGGSSYYALDVSDPDSDPILKWKIDANSDGFSKLGQSWSKPTVAHIKDPNTELAIPVIIIGGGYSTNKDSDGIGSNDSIGTGVYIVNADTGKLIWSASTATSGAHNLTVNFTDSIPGSVATLDSNFDGIVDRLYFADTGGNVWRTDMPTSKPFDDKAPWQVHKIAKLGGTSNATDLRFFAEPAVARSYTTITTKRTVDGGDGGSSTVYSRVDKPFDAILIGSGDRTSPTKRNANNKLFMIRDENIVTQHFENVPDAITIDDLYDYTDNPYGVDLTDEQIDALDSEVSQKQGWYVNLNGSGEKSLSTPSVIAGVAYFNSFTPADDSAGEGSENECKLRSGGGSLYAMDLHLGTNVYEWRKLDIGDKVPDKPTIIISPSEPDKLLFVGVGEGDGAGTLKICPAGQVCGDPPPCPEGENCCPPGEVCCPNGEEECGLDTVRLKTMRTNLYVTESNK